MRTLAPTAMAAAVTGLSLLACAGPTVDAPGGAGGATGPTLVHTAAFENCPWRLDDGGLRVIQSPAAWQQWQAQGQPAAAAVRSWLPRFETETVVIYSTGFKPSSGHAVQIGAPAWTGGGRVVQLPVARVTPPAGSLQATVMTSPCAIAWLKTAPAVSLRVVDAKTGAVLAEQPLLR